MIEQGTIVGLRNHVARIALKTEDECEHCFAQHMCGLGRDGLRYIEIEDTLGTQIGDVVEIYSPSQNVLLFAFLVYMAPLIMLLVGYMLGKGLSGSEHIGTVTAILALIGSFLGLRFVDKRIDKRIAKGATLHPVIKRVIVKESSE